MKKYMVIIVPLLAAFTFLGICTFLQFINYDRQEEKENERYLQIIGEIDNGVKPEYAITDILKNIKKPNAIEQGRERILTYGFDKDFIPEHSVLITDNKTLILISFIICFSICLFSIALAHIQYSKKRKKEFEEISLIIEQYMKGFYTIDSSFTNENEPSRFYHLLNRLGQMISSTNLRFLKEKEETKSLVTDISHQLKTPLASLKMCFSLLSEEDLTTEEKKEFTQRTWNQINKLTDLISALVNISRMEHGMISIKQKKAEISETLMQSVNSINMKAEEKNISIKADNLPSIQIAHDIRWTREAFTNVLENAIKYSPPGTTIRITMYELVTYIRIEISDEGFGIKKEEYNHIFQRFYRGKEESINKQEGSGVGLYLTRKILEMQESNIFASSNLDKGTTFIIQMPKSIDF